MLICLKELREERNILQKDLAEALNRTRACVSSWEQGKTEPSLDDLIRLADFFNCTIDLIVGREPYAPTTVEEVASPDEAIVEILQVLPENLKFQALGYVQALSKSV